MRRHELSLEARQRLLPRLLVPILQRLGQPADDVSVAVLEQQVSVLMRKAVEAELVPAEEPRQP